MALLGFRSPLIEGLDFKNINLIIGWLLLLQEIAFTYTLYKSEKGLDGFQMKLKVSWYADSRIYKQLEIQ